MGRQLWGGRGGVERKWRELVERENGQRARGEGEEVERARGEGEWGES